MIALWMLANCRNGVSSYEIARATGIAQKSAWFVLQRLRFVMKDARHVMMGATETPVEMDETFVGGKPKNMNEYVRGTVSTQAIENFWSCLKRTLAGTYVAVEPFHLGRYLDEQMLRFNNRIGYDDETRFQKALGQVAGKWLTWVELTGKEYPKVA